MIYRVVLDDTIDLHTSDINCMLLNPSLDLEMNSAGSFNFTLPPSHPYWDSIKVLKSTIDVYEDGDLIFTGRIASIEKNWNNERVVQCEGALAYFNDSIHRQMKWETPLPIASEDPTVHNFLKDILDNHNVFEGAENANRHIFIGNITVDPEVVTREVNYDTTLDILTRMCIDTNGGYMSVRKDLDDGKLYLDWIKDFTEESGQPAQFGLNLLNFDTSLNAEDICTGVLARGAEVNEQTVMLNNVELVDETTYPDMSVTHYTDKYQDILWHREGVEKFGQVVQVHDFSDAQTAWKDGQGQIVANSLFEMAKKWLEEKNTKIETIEVEVAELAWLGEGMPKYKLGQIVELSDDVHMAGESYETRLLPMYKLSCDLNSGSKKVTLGTPPKKELTQISASNSDSSTLSSSGSSSGSGGGSGEGEECRVHDVRVDGTSVVTNKIANISLAGKADVSTVNALATTVAGKADTSTVNALANVVSGKQDQIEFNTLEAATEVLTKLKADNKVYNLGGGTEVEANPSEAATDDLETIKIGNTVYDIPGGGSGGEPGLNVIETYGSAGSKSYTIAKAGLYAIFATVTYQGSCTITLPNDAVTVYSNDLTVSSRISKYLIVELPASSTVVISMTVSQWNGCCSGVIALKNIEINQVADSISKADTTASLTLPDDDKMYLVLASCAARSSSDARDNTTGGNPKYDEKVNPSSLSKLHLSLCKGSDSPTYSMYAYDGGIASIIAYELKKDLVYVEANPEGQATEDLNTILIDDTIYNIKGSGDSTNYGKFTYDLLLKNDPLPTYQNASNGVNRSYTLSKSIDDYDAVYVIACTDYNSRQTLEGCTDRLILKNNYYDSSHVLSGSYSDGRLMYVTFTDDTTVSTTAWGNGGYCPVLYKVYGVKFENKLINRSDIYSEEERMIGRWTDGKPLYQKTYDLGSATAFPNNTWTTIVSNVTIPFDKVIKCEGVQADPAAVSFDIWFDGSSNALKVRSLRDGNESVRYFTIQYTKTTDTPDSGVIPEDPMFISDPMIYSEEEQVVGSWTDGKPLYQKTFLGKMHQRPSDWIEFGSVGCSVDKWCYQEAGITYNDVSLLNEPYISVRCDPGSDKVYYYCSQMGNVDKLVDGFITVQYTKTTDSVLSGPKKGKIVQRSDIYSEEERLVGRWTDGKPLYQKTIKNIGVTLQQNTWTNTGIPFAGIDHWEVIFNKSNTSNYDNQYPMLYRFYNGNFQAFCQYTMSLDELTFQYTKTTDAPFSKQLIEDPQFVMMSDIYSEEEQVVGRWTDGKPIYQKTVIVSSGSLSSGTMNVPTTGITDVEKCIDWSCRLHSNSENRDFPIPYDRVTYSESIQCLVQVLADHTIGCTLHSGDRSSYNNIGDICITFKYTKTTDAPGTGPTKGNLIYLPALYSEEEREVGVWTDGKPIYQKTWDFSSSPIAINGGNQWQTLSGVSTVGMSEIIKAECVDHHGTSFNLYVAPDGDNYTHAVVNSQINITMYLMRLTLSYTKTTDQPGSGRYLPDGQLAHHYSTSEKVVGTWIDGSTVYERTWDFGTSGEMEFGPDTWVSTTISRSNINRIIKVDAISNSGVNWEFIAANCDSGSYVQLYHSRPGNKNIKVRYLTLQYTKTS